jgi:hypothetical protein
MHPWLEYFENEWPVTVLTRQILAKTSHNYNFEDWGDEDLLEKMQDHEDPLLMEEVSMCIPVVLLLSTLFA